MVRRCFRDFGSFWEVFGRFMEIVWDKFERCLGGFRMCLIGVCEV